MEERSLASQTEIDIEALNDSLWLINKVLEEDVQTQESNDVIDRNIEHIEAMIEKEHILNSGFDLSIFKDIVSKIKNN